MPVSGSVAATIAAMTGSATGEPLDCSRAAPRQTTTTASDGTITLAAAVRTSMVSPVRWVMTREMASERMSAVERAVQPLRSSSTEATPSRNGTVVTTRMAYQ